MRFDDFLDEDWNRLADDPLGYLKQARQAREKKRSAAKPAPREPVGDVKHAKLWWDQLVNFAEQGRKEFEDWLKEPGADLSAQIFGDQKGDPVELILKRYVAGYGILEPLKVLLNKVLHLPAIYKFFRHDTLQIGSDFVKSAKLVARNPGKRDAWGAFGYHLLNLARYPVALFMTGVGGKLTYQQYQLLQSMGFTDIDVVTVGAANAVVCWLLFLAFLTPHWLAAAEHRALKAVAFSLRHLFPQQMYKPVKEEFSDWAADRRLLVEDVSRYSVEVNYRTTKKEVLDAWAKLVLGFVSAALQREGYHVKHVYTDKPMRIMVSANNWDDGSWTSALVYDPQKECFVVSSGFWNKDRRTLSVQREETSRCAEDAASMLVGKMLNFMHELRKREPRKINKLKPVPMKRGPKG